MAKRSLLLGALLSLLLVAPASAKLLYVGDGGVATVGRVACKGKPACRLATPKRAAAKIGQRKFWVRVLAPKRIAPGRRGTVRVRFAAAALADLAGRTTTVAVRTVLRQDEANARTRLLKIRLRRAAIVAPESPTSGPLGTEPPLLARPATAVDVSGVSVLWHPRDSWIDYLVSTTFSNGALGVNSPESPCPVDPEPKPEPGGEPYTVRLTPKPSWFDPVSGSAAIYGQGSTHFRYPEHGIDLTASEPEVEINGAASRLILRLSGSGNSALPSQRVVFADLSLGGQPSKVEGSTHSYELMRATLAADSAAAFSTFYPPGTPWGCVSVSFTAPK